MAQIAGIQILIDPFVFNCFLDGMQTVQHARQAQRLILVDVGPNLGAINRSALLATDSVIIPLGADLFSLQGLYNLGPTLNRWRAEWKLRIDRWIEPKFALPQGKMQPIGYVVQQYGIRLSRPIKAYDRWVNRMPEVYSKVVLGKTPRQQFRRVQVWIQNCLGTINTIEVSFQWRRM